MRFPRVTRHPGALVVGATVVGALGVSLLAACTAPAAAPTPTPTPTPPAGAVAAGAVAADRTLGGEPLAACTVHGVAALCGALTVPEDRARPDGPTLDVRVAVVPATTSTPRPDPVVFLAGGPGGAATEQFGWVPTTFAELRAEHDLVFVDQRGTGGSNAMMVPPSPDTSDLDDAAAAEALAAWAADGLDDLPGDPRFYTTAAAMDDLEDVRASLGYERVNLYGPSYGATAAQYYLRQHGDRVRTVVLDGGSLLDVPLFEQLPASSQAAFDVLVARCAADAGCSAAFPDVAATFDALRERVAAEPVTLPVRDPATGRPAVLDAYTLATSVHAALVEPTTASRLPLLLEAASAGDLTTVATAVGTGLGATETQQLVMSLVIRCSEPWARFEPDAVARHGDTSYLTEAQVRIARNQAAVCAVVPRAEIRPDEGEPVRSDVPVLLLLGEGDPQDPLANVADAAEELPNSRTVVVPGAGHTVGHLGCLPSLIADFVGAGTVDGLDTSCADDVALPPFALP